MMNYISQRKFLFLSFFLLSFAVLFAAQLFFHPRVSLAETSTVVDCSRWNSQNINSKQFYTGFGVPWDVFSSTHEPLMKVLCDAGGVNISIGSHKKSQYIWNTAYISQNGSQWKKISLFGPNSRGDWLVGGATALLSPNIFGSGGAKYVLAYTCQVNDGVWKCGCRDKNTCGVQGKWQLQEIDQDVMSSQEGSGEVAQPTNTPSLSSLFKNAKFDNTTIFYPSNYVVSRGDRVVLSGGGFDGVKNVKLNGYGNIPAFTNKTNTSVTFNIPRDIRYGRYDISVSGDKGKSNEKFIVVKDPSLPTPHITSLLKRVVSPGEQITISGSGFTKTGNEIRLNIGIVSHIPSPDGKTLTFTLPEINQTLPPQVKQIMKSRGMSKSEFRDMQREGLKKQERKTGVPPTMPGALLVVNDQGLSNKVTFTVSIKL